MASQEEHYRDIAFRCRKANEVLTKARGNFDHLDPSDTHRVIAQAIDEAQKAITRARMRAKLEVPKHYQSGT